ncbi:hypothetical protein ZIOFF_049475 [Zingiber officinale]|uniref:Ubiquitin/SUMO-activating enzyme ubiquitin-like domain-containing protein n=1 Tax=Zingiber officinale TaxID=94328 RepID=A0A8J5KYJ8_ZINOF|nr:hypothetical protein ZIOFF_049475 [Zingiber officinale]
MLLSSPTVASQSCRDDFDEEKEPDRMVLSGWTAPEKVDTAKSNGASTSADRPIITEATESKVVDVAAAMPGTKRKLSATLERKGNQEVHEVLSVPGNDDDDDLVLLDDCPEPNKKLSVIVNMGVVVAGSHATMALVVVLMVMFTATCACSCQLLPLLPSAPPTITTSHKPFKARKPPKSPSPLWWQLWVLRGFEGLVGGRDRWWSRWLEWKQLAGGIAGGGERSLIPGNDDDDDGLVLLDDLSVLEHPSRKMLWMPVEPFEPNKSCYVCSETPLLLEVNTRNTTLRDIVEKIIKVKLGMNLPMVMQGTALIYEDGDDLEEDVAANYALNLDKNLADLPAPLTGGTMLTIEDFQQELKCHINIKHRLGPVHAVCQVSAIHSSTSEISHYVRQVACGIDWDAKPLCYRMKSVGQRACSIVYILQGLHSSGPSLVEELHNLNPHQLPLAHSRHQRKVGEVNMSTLKTDIYQLAMRDAAQWKRSQGYIQTGRRHNDIRDRRPYKFMLQYMLLSSQTVAFQSCRDDFEEEKEPDHVVLSGWTAPQKVDTAKSNGASTSADRPIKTEATESKVVDVAAAMPGTKRKLSATLEREGNQEVHQVLSVPGNDDDDLVLLDGCPEPNKKLRLQHLSFCKW